MLIKMTKHEALPEGVYHARLVACALETPPWSDDKQQLHIQFDILDGEFAGKSVQAWANPKLTAGKKPSKLHGWCSALVFGGKPVPEDYLLDTNDLIGREGLLVLEVVVKEAGTFNRIASILPLRRNGGKPAAAPMNAQSPAVASRATAEPEFAPVDWDSLSAAGPESGDEVDHL